MQEGVHMVSVGSDSTRSFLEDRFGELLARAEEDTGGTKLAGQVFSMAQAVIRHGDISPRTEELLTRAIGVFRESCAHTVLELAQIIYRIYGSSIPSRSRDVLVETVEYYTDTPVPSSGTILNTADEREHARDQIQWILGVAGPGLPSPEI